MNQEPPFISASPFDWNRIDCSKNPLNLTATLSSGQAFRWRRDSEGIWWGVIEKSVCVLWQEEMSPQNPLFWQTFPTQNQESLIRDYFRLEVDVLLLYSQWLEKEPQIALAIEAYHGLRILRQVPQECFFSFQCATCNTIIKIERSVSALAKHYGKPIEIGFESPFEFYVFPDLETLANAEESIRERDQSNRRQYDPDTCRRVLRIRAPC